MAVAGFSDPRISLEANGWRTKVVRTCETWTVIDVTNLEVPYDKRGLSNGIDSSTQSQQGEYWFENSLAHCQITMAELQWRKHRVKKVLCWLVGWGSM